MTKLNKIITKIIVMWICVVPIINFNAASRAYSVGSKYAKGVEKEGSDFTQNVLTAADAYGWLSGYTSYYSNEPTYNYMKGSRLGSSEVYFINGHSNDEAIYVAAKNTDEHRSGITTGKNGEIHIDELKAKYTLAGLSGRDMKNTKLITFVGCNTGAKYQSGGVALGSTNLTQKAHAQGAKTAVGFSDEILSRSESGQKWLKIYNSTLGNGGSVEQAIEKAHAAYPTSRMKSAVIEGSKTTTLGTAKKSAPSANFLKSYSLMNLEEREDLKPLEEIYKVLNVTSTIEFNLFDENKYHESLIPIFKEIKKYENNFDEKDYKISYHIVNEEDKYGYIFINYFINNTIKTNKVYLVKIDNNKVTKIILAGVKEKNIANIKAINNEDMMKKVINFDKNDKFYKLSDNATKLFKSKNILTKSNAIDANSLFDSITEYEETYYYDYNSQKLSYNLITFEKSDLYVMDGEEIDFIL